MKSLKIGGGGGYRNANILGGGMKNTKSWGGGGIHC